MINRNSGHIILGIIIISLGIVFLFDLNFGEFLSKAWPLLLIAFGLYLIFSHRGMISLKVESARSESYESGIPGVAGDIKVSGLKDGIGMIEKKLMFGDIVINLSDSKLLEGENTIDTSVLFGDITVIIPQDFPVKVDLAAFVGDLDFKGRRVEGITPSIKHTDDNYANAGAKLFVKGRLCFGDIKVLITSK